MDVKELNKEVKVSVGMLVAIAAAAFSIGAMVDRIKAQSDELKQVKQFVLEEVSGLRSDWERRYYDNINPRLEKLEEK